MSTVIFQKGISHQPLELNAVMEPNKANEQCTTVVVAVAAVVSAGASADQPNQTINQPTD